MKKIIARLIGKYLNLLVLISPRAAGRKGFYLFCTPHGTPLKDHQKKFLNTADKFSFLRDGITIQGYRWGTGERKILFLHGWQSHTFRWKNYIEALPKDKFTIYALDAPGHGLSGGRYLNIPVYSNVIEEFLAHVQPIDTVIGHSLGSFAILYTFFRFPALPVNNLVVTGTAAEAKEFTKYFQKVLGLSDRSMIAIERSFVEAINHLPEYFSAAKFAKDVKIPMLIIHDREDNETPYQHAMEINTAAINSRLITTSGLGHNLRSAEVVKHVVEFVSQSDFDHRKVLSNLKAVYN